MEVKIDKKQIRLIMELLLLINETLNKILIELIEEKQ